MQGEYGSCAQGKGQIQRASWGLDLACRASTDPVRKVKGGCSVQAGFRSRMMEKYKSSVQGQILHVTFTAAHARTLYTAALQAASHYSDLGTSPHTIRPLWASLQALYLELGTCAVAGGFGTASFAALPALDGGACVCVCVCVRQLFLLLFACMGMVGVVLYLFVCLCVCMPAFLAFICMYGHMGMLGVVVSVCVLVLCVCMCVYVFVCMCICEQISSSPWL
jgi:hypothetical protein